jgi:phage-related protein
MNDDGQVPMPEAASLGWKFKAGSESPAQAGRGSVWLCSLPRSGGEEARPGQASQGFGSAGVLEVTEDWDRSTYRAVYTVQFKAAVFVLHVFQKKSTRGAATPKADIDLIRERLKIAEQFARELLP